MLNRKLIEELARAGNKNLYTVSMFVDLTPSKSKSRNDYKPVVGSLVNEAHEKIRQLENNGLTHTQKDSLKEDLGKIDDFFEMSLDREGAKSIAVFSSSKNDLWQTEKMPQPVKNRVIIDEGPYIRPLLRVLDEYKHFCVLLISRDKSRLFRIFAEEMAEHSEIFDIVPGKQKQGGWSQMRIQRHIEDHVNWHVKRTMDMLMDYFNKNPFDYLIISTTEELLPLVEKRMHPYIKEKYIGNLRLEMNSGIDSIKNKTLEFQHKLEAEEQKRVLDRIVNNQRTGRGAAWGIEGVLSEISKNHVDTLVLERGFKTPGYKCGNCGHITYQNKKCPVCGSKLYRVDDIIEEAVEAAYENNASVVFIDSTPMDYKLKKIAALTRER